MQIIENLKEASVKRLSTTSGEELDITGNLTHPMQIDAIMEMQAHAALGSKYIVEKKELYQRLTCSYGGRHRSDVVEIAKAPEWVERGFR